MATSAMRVSPGVLHLDKRNRYREMVSFPTPSKKPVCPRYERGECKGSGCPYFHPKDLVIDKPTQPTQGKTTTTATKQRLEPPKKPPVEPTPAVSVPNPPQQPKNNKKSAPPTVVPERQKQKPPSESSRPAEPQTPQVPVPSTHSPQQRKPSPPSSGSQTKARASDLGGPAVRHTENSKNPPAPASTRPQVVASCSVASRAVTKNDPEPGPAQEIPSSSSTSGTSRKSTKHRKKAQKTEDPSPETSLPPESVSSEQDSIQESPSVQLDKEGTPPPKRYVCRNYLHKKCRQDTCRRYHDPSLEREPPLCDTLYVRSCTRNVCKFYHPENNRLRVICQNFIMRKCYNQNCPRYHFKLPVVEEVAPVKREPSAPLPSNGINPPPVKPPTSQSSSSFTPAIRRTDADLCRPQCPAWNNGYCPEGRNCKLLHLHRVIRWLVESEQAAAQTMDRMIFDNTKVVFGAGCEIKQVVTALESCRVLISNLPARTTKETLEDFLSGAGFNRETFYILILRMSVDRETQEASVIFNDARNAKTVVKALDKKEYFDEVLKLELAPAVTPGRMDDWTYNRSSYLEVNINAPSKRVQAVYPTVEHAIEKVKVLNGGQCRGRTVHVTVARRPRPDERWTYIKNSIIISNVAPDTLDSDILKFAEPFSIKTFSLRRFRVDLALQRLEDHMRTVGDLKPGDFDVVQNFRKGKIFVRSRFDTWEQANKVWQSLQESDLEFLAQGHAQTFLAFPHQYSLHIPLEHYDAQKEIYDRLESQHGRDPTVHLVATRYREVCLIQVVGIDKKAVGALKLKVERIAQGEVVGVWDRFFLDWQGEAFFGRMLRQHQAYVRPDRMKQVLRIYGSEAAVDHARREIMEQMKSLAALDYQMTIEDHCVGFFIRKGMKILGDMLGEENVWLHTTSKPYFVSVRGGHDAEHALQKLVSEALSRPSRPLVLDWSQTCPLCFEEPTQSFPLACRHIYCTGCLKHMLISAVDGKSIPICCIGNEGRCKTPIPLPVIERFISPVRLTQMFENTFRVHLQLHPNEFRFCPTPDCTQVYRVSTEDSAVIQCPACLIETCSHCHKSPHRGLTCEENSLIGSKGGQEALLDRWARGHSNVKKCPDCGIFIEKIDGCNHIHCRCGGHVCWICAKTFNNGIYDHLNAVHGGAYDLDH